MHSCVIVACTLMLSFSEGVHDVSGYVKPSMQDLFLLDIQYETLLEIGEIMEIQYLGENIEIPSFPVTGLIFMPNGRLMVNLVCSLDRPRINIIFMIDTGSPVTYLSQQAIQALVADPLVIIPKSLIVRIHDGTVMICHVSPQDKHFADVNVLGMDYLSSSQLSINLNYKEKTVELIKL